MWEKIQYYFWNIDMSVYGEQWLLNENIAGKNLAIRWKKNKIKQPNRYYFFVSGIGCRYFLSLSDTYIAIQTSVFLQSARSRQWSDTNFNHKFELSVKCKGDRSSNFLELQCFTTTPFFRILFTWSCHWTRVNSMHQFSG